VICTGWLSYTWPITLDTEPGHGITHGLLKSLFSDSENFEIISCDQDIVDTLPGSGVQLSEVCKVA